MFCAAAARSDAAAASCAAGRLRGGAGFQGARCAAGHYVHRDTPRAQQLLIAQRRGPLQREWWTLLGSPKLNALIGDAVQGNRELAAAQATLVQAQELSYAASGARYPQLAFDASAGRDKYGAAFLGPEKLPPFNFFSLGPTLNFVLDTSGAVRRTIEQQQALTEAQQDQVDQTYLTLTGNVALQALAIAATQAQISTVNALIGDDSENLRLVETAQQAGSATEVDRLNAASQLANDQTLLPPLEQQLHVAQHALSVLMGRYPANWTPPEFELEDFVLPDDVPLALPAELVHRRPDIRAAEAQLHAATAAVGVAAQTSTRKSRSVPPRASNRPLSDSYSMPAAGPGVLPAALPRRSMITGRCARDDALLRLPRVRRSTAMSRPCCARSRK